MELDSLIERLAQGEILTLPRDEWEELAPRLEVIEDHDTQLSGRLLIVRTGGRIAAVETPKGSERVVRPLADLAAARAFVEDRLETYERMWDGCGCKVDYYR